MAQFNQKQRVAVPVGRLNGRNVYRVPVTINYNDSQRCATVARRTLTVLAYGAADAANWTRDNVCDNRPETEIVAAGPKGGKVTRYIGWESAIGSSLFGSDIKRKQLDMFGH